MKRRYSAYLIFRKKFTLTQKVDTRRGKLEDYVKQQIAISIKILSSTFIRRTDSKAERFKCG